MDLTKNDIILLLKNKGYRITENRLSVIEILSEVKHITFNELVERLEQKYTDVNIMSVYNSIDVLLKEHILFTNTFDGKQIWYDLIVNPSLHLICDKCHKIVHVPQEELINKFSMNNLIESIKKMQWYPTHFKIEAHGFCIECQKEHSL